MEKSTCFCPNPDCPRYGQMGSGLIVVKSQVRCQWQCNMCGKLFSDQHGTAWLHLHADRDRVCRALKALAEGLSLRATARVFDVDKDDVCHWLDVASQHCARLAATRLKNLPLGECQLDELWSFVRKKERNLTALERVLGQYGDAWVWVAFAPEFKLVPAFVVGKRTQEEANTLIAQVAAATDGGKPLYLSDQLPHYRQALLNQYGVWQQPVRQGARGRHPHRRLVAPADLLYAVVVKHYRQHRVVKVSTRVVFGVPAEVQARLALAGVSQRINTAHGERGNLSWRQHCRRLTRKTNGFSKERDWLEKHLTLCFTYYHFVLPHESLRLRLEPPLPTKGSGSPKKWQPRTPAMAAGITDHVWTMEELLSYRVSPLTG